MTPFLKQVAEHFFAAPEVEHHCFIFPNRRSMVFFQKYLGEQIALKGKAMKAPLMYTMNDFFYTASGKSATDRVHLLLELYSCYSKLYKDAESLDDFIFWGDILISDFDDVDKYLVDAWKLFRNISDYRSMQDDFSYLSEAQKEAIERFLGHFKSEGEIKERFKRIWDILLDLYNDFHTALDEKGLCYEGMVYRSLAERLSSEPASSVLEGKFQGCRDFVFVGLNALNECEKKMLGKLRDAGLAQFCWDFCSDEIKDSHNKSSFFLKDNVSAFRQAFEPSAGKLSDTEFNVLSLPSTVGQAAQIPSILSRLGGPVGINTAIVLPDEDMIIPILNSIPESIRDINVTMGYPMGGSELRSLMSDIAALQMHLREKDGKWYFYHKQVWSVLSNSTIKVTLSEEDSEKIASIRKEAGYYVCEDRFKGIPLLELIFTPIVKDNSSCLEETIRRIERYQQDILGNIASRLKACGEDMSVEIEFAREFYLAIGKLSNHKLQIKPATYFHLLNQLTSNSAIPFKGEPLKGLQIMGPLETRALDFENIIILGCNEGLFPRKSAGHSFIPPELRRGYGLPTYEYQDAVWAYYFYRMIQRARKVWMLYDSRTEMSRSGEQSRYIRQLEMHFGASINYHVLHSGIDCGKENGFIAKTGEDVEKIRQGSLSASSLRNYLNCPAKFYFESVKGLKAAGEVSETLDGRMTGNVFHKVIERLYRAPKISSSYLKSLLEEDNRTIRNMVREQIVEELHGFEIGGRNILSENIIIKFVKRVIQSDIEHLKAVNAESFTMLGVELPVSARISGFNFTGIIDRLDSISPHDARIVDYKTGIVSDNDFIITADNAPAIVESLFDRNCKDKPEIALQLYLYDIMSQGLASIKGRHVSNSVYQPQRLFSRPVENIDLCPEFCSLMKEKMQELLKEIADVSVSFEMRPDEKRCSFCNFKQICRR